MLRLGSLASLGCFVWALCPLWALWVLCLGSLSSLGSLGALSGLSGLGSSVASGAFFCSFSGLCGRVASSSGNSRLFLCAPGLSGLVLWPGFFLSLVVLFFYGLCGCCGLFLCSSRAGLFGLFLSLVALSLCSFVGIAGLSGPFSGLWPFPGLWLFLLARSIGSLGSFSAFCLGRWALSLACGAFSLLSRLYGPFLWLVLR